MWAISLLVLVIAYCKAGLVIKSPESARRYFENGEGVLKMGIPSTGITPYGSSVTGQFLYVESNQNACRPYYFDLHSELYPEPFVLVKDGNCSLSQKIKNVQTDGGKLMILISQYQHNIDNFPTPDYDPADFIKIPSIVIKSDDAANLVGVYKSFNEQKLAVELEAKFETEQSWDIVQLEFWFLTIDHRVISFIKDFKSFRETLGPNINFVPHYLASTAGKIESTPYESNNPYNTIFDTSYS
jgi:hypothetical protein